MSEKLSINPSIDPTASLSSAMLGTYTGVGARTKLHEVTLGDYSYVVNDSDIAYATIGKFTSIAAMTRINPGNHPMQRVSQSHFTYRASAYFDDAQDEDTFFAWRRSYHVSIGHDVWIGHGAIVLPGRSIGTGAVIGAGCGGDQGYSCLRNRRRQSGAGVAGRALRRISPRALRHWRGGTGRTNCCAPPWRISARYRPSSSSISTRFGRRCRISSPLRIEAGMRIQGGADL